MHNTLQIFHPSVHRSLKMISVISPERNNTKAGQCSTRRSYSDSKTFSQHEQVKKLLLNKEPIYRILPPKHTSLASLKITPTSPQYMYLTVIQYATLHHQCSFVALFSISKFCKCYEYSNPVVLVT